MLFRSTDDQRHVLMVVRRGTDPKTASAQLQGSTNFAAEGTIIGDGRKWDTVQFVAVDSEAELDKLHATTSASITGDSYVMAVRASMDSITQG